MVSLFLFIAAFNAVLIIVITALELHERLLQKQAKQSSFHSGWKQKNDNIRLQGNKQSHGLQRRKQTANRNVTSVPELFQTTYVKAERIA